MAILGVGQIIAICLLSAKFTKKPNLIETGFLENSAPRRHLKILAIVNRPCGNLYRHIVDSAVLKNEQLADRAIAAHDICGDF